jgi:hypothetical protein
LKGLARINEMNITVFPNPISSAKIPPLHLYEEEGNYKEVYPENGLK